MLAGATIAVALLLTASAILSAAEAAVFSISKSRLRTVEEEGFDGATALVELRSRPDRMRSALILCNVVLNIVAAGIMVAAAVQFRGVLGAWVAIPLSAIGTVFFGEFLPRLLAARRPVSLAINKLADQMIKDLVSGKGSNGKTDDDLDKSTGLLGRLFGKR